MKARARASVLALALVFLVAAAAADTMAPEYEQTLELIGLVEDAVALVEDEGIETACEQFRAEDSRWFYDQIYVFLLNMDGTAICHPASPTLEGRELIELRDPKGKPVVAGMVRELETSDEGWIHYQWPRPDDRVFRWKTSYVRKADGGDGGDVIVGSGRYQMKMEPFFVVEQVDDAIEEIRDRGEEEAFATFRDPSSGFLFYSAYVFVLDADGVLLVNNGFPENEGKNLTEMKDIDGKAFVREMLTVPLGDGAWVHYKWPKPRNTRPAAKSSFVRRVRIGDRELVVGSGVYFEDEPAVRELGPKPDTAAPDSGR